MERVVLALVRHGHYQQPTNVPSAHLPYPLTDAGEQQARAAADTLLTWASDNNYVLHPIIDTSPTLRAWQTANIIGSNVTAANQQTMELEETPHLAERCLGPFANLTVDAIQRTLEHDPRYESPPRGWSTDAHFKLPGVGSESLREAGARAAAHIVARVKDLEARAECPTLKIFVGHGGAMREAAMALDLLSQEAANRCALFHGRPVLYQANRNRPWQQVHGEWKKRSAREALE